MVCELKPVEKEIMVNVCKCVPVEQTKTCTVMTRVAKTQEVTVNVCKCVPVEKTGKKTIWECIPTKQMVKQVYYVQEPYETTVKVAVPCAPAPCATTACAPVSDCGGCGVRRLGGCCR